MLKDALISYFGNQEVWVDAHDEETAQELVDWLSGEIGDNFGSVHRGYTDQEGFWQYITLTNGIRGWHINAYGDCVNLRSKGYCVVGIEDFPFDTPFAIPSRLPSLDDLI